jgi:hypothetical protein
MDVNTHFTWAGLRIRHLAELKHLTRWTIPLVPNCLHRKIPVPCRRELAEWLNPARVQEQNSSGKLGPKTE